MKKKIIALSAALMMFAGVVSASSINGDYKGNPIVKVMSNGKQVETDEVPAQIYDGHTVVPISLLRQLGASVTWDAETYSVDVKLNSSTVPSTTSNTSTQSIASVMKLANESASKYKSRNVKYVINELGSYVSVDVLSSGDVTTDLNNVAAASTYITNTDAGLVFVNLYSNNDSLGYYAINVEDVQFAIKNVQDINEYMKKWKFTPSQKLPSIAHPSDLTPAPISSSAIESSIDGDFNGFEGDTIIKLMNGQIWQQDDSTYSYHYSFGPKVTIYKDGTSFKIMVDGIDKKVKVKRIK